MSKIVRYRAEDIPPISDERLEEMRLLSLRPDSEIDFSDIPEWTDEQWESAKKHRGQFYRPTKSQITAKVDRDVLEWLKSDGPGYQSRMNAILRREMLKALAEKREAA